MSIQSKGIMATLGTVLGATSQSIESVAGISGSYMKEWEKSRKAQEFINADNRQKELKKQFGVSTDDELIQKMKVVKDFDKLLMSLE